MWPKEACKEPVIGALLLKGARKSAVGRRLWLQDLFLILLDLEMSDQGSPLPSCSAPSRLCDMDMFL